ncbi:MAG: hypothetical protein CMN58_04015 [Solibacterales bacterium]|nr:hypothetical protein [Bryobacterales bacterium]|tara:strand:- start:9738 stop:10850 length:1113 start_codon:yes stop_codon:yes gene_type:complete
MIKVLIAVLVLILTACASENDTPLFESEVSLDEIVYTVAGVGISGAGGDGGSGKEAQLGNPFGVVIGPDGSLYICEVDTHRVRRLDLHTNVISTVAGTGRKGYSGDGGSALEADLNEPYEVRFSQSGDMYFVEMQNHVVRKVDAATGIISTVVGTGEAGYSGDGGKAIKAQLHNPHSIEFDESGFLYIADIGNHRIRRVELPSGVIDTFAGTGDQAATPNGSPVKGTPLNGPRAIAFDRQGDMFLALREGNSIYRISMKEKVLHHVAGTGSKGYAGDGSSAKQALLSGPKGISVGSNGDVYIADTESHTIRRIDLQSGLIETVVGTGNRHDGPDGDPDQCGLARPHGVFVAHDGSVYIGDSENHRVRVLR